MIAAVAYATDVVMTFASLPSAQGWTWVTGGSPPATEAGTWSVAGGVLTLDTMDFEASPVGALSYYQQNGIVSPPNPVVIELRARVLQWEGNGSQYQSNAFCFGFAEGATEWMMGITTNTIHNVNGTLLSSAFDNTQFHDYRIEWSPPSTVAYYVDNTLISTNSAGIAAPLNRILIGDGTAGGNARRGQSYASTRRRVAGSVDDVGGIKALYQ
jgi:hypothetical protein